MSDSLSHATFVAPEISRLAPLFPGYEIQSLIATGGMGAVYRAVQKSLDRTVAIKVLPEELSKDASFCASFEAEAKAMARLNHPNLIGVFDFGEVEGMLFIVMEYVPGQSLFHSAHGIAIDPSEVIRLLTGICNGLAHAHEHGIIHRDIKPSNILLELNAQPKIGDFGLARPVERKDLEGEEIFGTPHYTAPEVVDSPQSVGFRADIFSVGVMLHELLTGRLPSEDPRRASVICRCDPRFDLIIRRATNPTPELRYASAAEIARDLQAIARDLQAIAKPSSPRGPMRPAPVLHSVPRAGVPARNPVPVQKTAGSSALVWILLLLAAGIVAATLLMNDKEVPQTPVEEPTSESSVTVEKKPVLPSPTPEPAPVVPRPEPEPDPVPPPAPQPMPEPVPEPVPEPEPAPVLAAPPVFDVEGFHQRARMIMKDRTAPLLAERDKEIKKNLAAMEREFKRMIRKLPDSNLQKVADQNLDVLMKQLEIADHRIPLKLEKPLSASEPAKAIHQEYLEKQKAIDQKLVDEVNKLSATYLQGLRNQMERLVVEQDDAAAKLIGEEINQVKEDAGYFPLLMLGEADPAIAKPVPLGGEKKKPW